MNTFVSIFILIGVKFVILKYVNRKLSVMPKSALFLSGEILKRANEQNIGISNMSLQKLIYIVNGLYLAKVGEPLINEPVEVWPYGPVIRDVYFEFKDYGNNDINKTPLIYSLTQNKDLDKTANDAIEFALTSAKNLNAIELSNWTHLPDSPWTKANAQGLSVIPNDAMAEFFKQFIRKTDD